jgi:hypothetical protein
VRVPLLRCRCIGHRPERVHTAGAEEAAATLGCDLRWSGEWEEGKLWGEPRRTEPSGMPVLSDFC